MGKKLLYFAGLSISASGWQNLLPIFHCYFSLEITPVYMQYSCAVTEWKNQNLMMYVFCSNTLIFAPECWKCILRDPDFKIFPETCTFGARQSSFAASFFLLHLLQSFYLLFKILLKTLTLCTCTFVWLLY